MKIEQRVAGGPVFPARQCSKNGTASHPLFNLHLMLVIRLGKNGGAGVADLQRLVLPAYLAGGAVMTIASIFNPISPGLILTAGVGASFGLNAGLLFVPGIVAGKAHGQPIDASPLPLG